MYSIVEFGIDEYRKDHKFYRKVIDAVINILYQMDRIYSYQYIIILH